MTTQVGKDVGKGWHLFIDRMMSTFIATAKSVWQDLGNLGKDLSHDPAILLFGE